MLQFLSLWTLFKPYHLRMKDLRHYVHIFIRSLHDFATYGESLDLEPKYVRIVPHTLSDAASTVRP